ncbi:MAG: helix-turn-helix domain-containing protein [Rhodospirillales bacterium]|nr:helix-turn-helix domain-containing protein [Rhodospirillales bacterium]MDH3910304.1 helix-turn-helix domain-containing protein [Rhodospirillales bacterium]MDH3918115.1 helix-turn-helix domain-containing protein [Rhodospirillales bacterium]MDH3968980.1 helix-turn-helix domain-containing protein [Rhodospirillales bacterium]
MYSWARRLNDLLVLRGWSQAELARRAGVSKENVKKYCQGAVGQPRGDTIPHLADALDVHFVWLRDGVGPQWRRIPVVGYVGAGEQFHAVDDLSQGAGLDSVDFDLGGVDPIAVEVRGESMLPVYRPGDRLLCSRLAGSDESGFLGKDCVVKLTSGAGYVKRVVRSGTPGHYTLLSYAAEPIADVALEWAAPILWIKRAV